MRRRQRGSEVQITDALTRVPTVTETDEAETLHTVDLDEMASMYIYKQFISYISCLLAKIERFS